MRKSKIYLLISTVLITTSVGLISCGNDENKVEKTVKLEKQDDTEEKDNNDSSDIESEISEKNKKNDDLVEDSENSEEDKEEEKSEDEDNAKSKGENEKIKITYPTFKNIQNADKINEIVEDFAEKIDDMHNSDGETTLETTYKITREDHKCISIYFTGDIKSSTAAYPSKFRATLNIGVEAGAAVTLNDIEGIEDEDFINKVNTEIEKKFKELGTEVLAEFKKENLVALLKTSDVSGEYLSEVQSYQADSYTGIILSVPHALGDYIELQIPF